VAQRIMLEATHKFIRPPQGLTSNRGARYCMCQKNANGVVLTARGMMDRIYEPDLATAAATDIGTLTGRAPFALLQITLGVWSRDPFAITAHGAIQ
jgi:hypothetical protein